MASLIRWPKYFCTVDVPQVSLRYDERLGRRWGFVMNALRPLRDVDTVMSNREFATMLQRVTRTMSCPAPSV